MPVIEDLAKRHPAIKFSKIDVYKGKNMAQRLGLKGDPCVVLRQGGAVSEVLPLEGLSPGMIDDKVKTLTAC